MDNNGYIGIVINTVTNYFIPFECLFHFPNLINNPMRFGWKHFEKIYNPII